MYDLLDLSVGTLPVDQRTQYHTYWRADLAPFGQRQEWMLKSFFATQNIARTRLVLWSNGDLSHNPILQKYVRSFPNAFAIQRVDIPGLAKGTELDGVLPLLHTRDDKAWIDGDLIRLLVLWNYGGVWVDMDSLLTRDLEPLLEHEFVTQWDCYGAADLRAFTLILTCTQTNHILLSTALSCASADIPPTSAKHST